MLETRAYTYVDAGNARLGTPWSERCWSAFLGNTVSLRDRGTQREWLAGPAQDIGIVVAGEPLTFMDFQGGNWSEECNPHGAVLVCTLTGHGITLVVRSTAMHGSPGILREMQVFNRSKQPVTAASIVLDHLGLDLPSGRKDLFRRVSESVVTAGDDGGSLLVGHDPGVKVEVNLEEGAELTMRCGTDFVVPPGKYQKLPTTYVMPFTGPYERVAGRAYADFLRGVRDLRAWEQDAAAS